RRPRPAAGNALMKEKRMKKIEAIVRPHLLEAVKNALQEVGVVGMTVSEVKGYGRQKGHTETYRGSEYKVELIPKVKIEIAIPEELAEGAVEAVPKTAKTRAAARRQVSASRPYGRAGRTTSTWTAPPATCLHAHLPRQA